MTPAATVLAEALRRLPAAEAAPLRLAPGATAVPVTAIDDPAWLDRQLALRGQRWRTDDRRVLATLWWYSVSNWFQVPAIASLVATGRALSPLPDDVAVHWLPDSRVTGGTSSRVLEGPDPVLTLAAALRQALERVVPPVAAAGGMKERPLWAIAADSTANRFLWAGRAIGDETRAAELAQRVAEAVGPPLPRVRWIDVVPMDDGQDRPDLGEHRFLRRASCCLLYEAPGQGRCGACPGRTPQERLVRLRLAAATRAIEP
ncbi:(2Fe-2S)-binding protein [Blastococcus sp. CCUG 61487]|uniref:(2Fe-2S)-binding protein n=1 Tax=Blastococcus sp. CCUG 61487 TaxID=1840703 RepID=UPI0010C022E8|nr:(2Fe-2S)-binding protein [Blastococcus sp. CCUG 61487]TKJ18278.1 hypothetical protein A6V29_11785 [Blastococcus sp. CCUG 61487]